VCPTDPVDVVSAADGKRDLVTMRWGLVPWWWSKPLKELRMATFNARAEMVETKPVYPFPCNRPPANDERPITESEWSGELTPQPRILGCEI
jgi:putative SOS response-associated peptidase YedK